jgi:uncharacterized protein (DUF433 family)
MAPNAELLTASEAAVVAAVSVRDIHRLIDESILPDSFVGEGKGRHILAAACSLIAFYFESGKRLTAEERLWAIKNAEPRLCGDRTLPALLKEDWTFRHEFLTIDLRPFLRRTSERLARLKQARAMVVSSPEVLSGTPVIRGTRVPVYDVAASVAAGIPRDRILAGYPSLKPDQLDLAALYAEAVPPRGRPRIRREPPRDASVITERRAGARLNQLTTARRAVSSLPQVLGGTVVFKGTRIPVHDIADMLANGDTPDAIVRAYPRLDKERVRLARIYAAAYPRRGGRV